MGKRFRVTPENVSDVRVWLMGKIAKGVLTINLDVNRLGEMEYLNKMITDCLTIRERNLLSRAVSSAKARRKRANKVEVKTKPIHLPDDIVNTWAEVAEKEGMPKTELLLEALRPYIRKHNL